jgi:hypothetical protein
MFVPPGTSVSASLSVLQAPYVVQSLIEASLKKQTASLPPFVPIDCHLALKKYLCAQVYLRAETKAVATILYENSLGGPVYESVVVGNYGRAVYDASVVLPSYEDNDICMDFVDKCRDFFSLAPALVTNCTAKASPGVEKFPTARQAVAIFPITVNAGNGPQTFNLKLYTAPNNMSAPVGAAYVYAPTCPYGYVVPEHPDNSRVQWVDGTACALACQ